MLETQQQPPQRQQQQQQPSQLATVKAETLQTVQTLLMTANPNKAGDEEDSPLSRAVTQTDESLIFTNQSSIQSQNTSNPVESSETVQPTRQDVDDVDLPEEQEEEEQQQHHQQQNYQLQAEEEERFYDADEQTNLLSPQDDQSLHPEDPKSKLPITMHSNGSYIQDVDEENTVLLNNFTQKRRNTTTTFTAQRPSAPAIRNSITTTNSKNVDTATLEIERMRNSVLSKRERKKQKSLVDDDRVLIGNKVSEGHVNYVIAYNMLTGIRVAVSRCSGIMKPLQDEDFKLSKKLVFDISGNELTPSSKYDFKFKDYCPTVFRELRILFGLDPADYLVSLTSKYILSELNSPGKSGSFFYFSRDYRFIIKTIHPSEHRQLRHILKDYHQHVKNNPNTMISQFYGLHRVKMPIYYGKRRKIYFIVMNNLFPPHRDIHKTFDLKGSLLGRYTTQKPNHQSVMKDLNWLETKEVIRFGPERAQIFVDQLKKDVELLKRLNIMDYSFLIGFHDLAKGNDEETLKRKKLSVFSPISSNLNVLKSTNPKLINGLNDFPNFEFNNGNIFYSNEGGIEATDENNEVDQYIYYLGIIDCLTDYSLLKRLETFWRSLRNDRKLISAVPPKEYGDRFLKFILNSINENNASLEKMKKD